MPCAQSPRASSYFLPLCRMMPLGLTGHNTSTVTIRLYDNLPKITGIRRRQLLFASHPQGKECVHWSLKSASHTKSKFRIFQVGRITHPLLHVIQLNMEITVSPFCCFGNEMKAFPTLFFIRMKNTFIMPEISHLED